MFANVQDGFFDLASGCDSPCQCNPVGSIGITCHPVSGQCTCKDNIAGDVCDRPMAGYFYKTLDDIVFEAEDADFMVSSWCRELWALVGRMEWWRE